MINKYKRNGGEMDFMIMILIFLVVLFVIWVLLGGQNSKSADKPFITPGNDNNAPLQPYGSKN